MSTTSKKHQDFVSEPMGEKEVTAIAGIGDVLGTRLSDKGFDKVCLILTPFLSSNIIISNYFSALFQAYVLLGQFLILKKDEELFKEWLKENSGANAHQAGNCYTCLKEWCNSYI